MKHILRKKLVEKRKNMDLRFVRFKSEKIKDLLFELELFKNSEKVGLYFSKDNEVCTKEIIEQVIKSSKRVFLPAIENDNIGFREITSIDNLEIGRFNVFEPKKNCPVINPEKLDIVIVPCVGVDEEGNRIGRGKGFYDRFLEKYKISKTVCLAYDFQILKNIKIESQDRKIDLVISNKGIIKNGSASHRCKLLDGKKLSSKILSEVKRKIENRNLKLKLSAIIVGNDPSSELYVKIKKKKCKEVGISFDLIRFKENIPESKIIQKIKELNNNENVIGILVQLPLPQGFNTNKILNTILLEKDVDCLTKVNREIVEKGDETLACCTPKAIIRLLDENKISLKDKKVVLVGYGYLVGKPLASMLRNRNIEFKVCDSKTKKLEDETRKADILITATGVTHLIKAIHVKEGAVVVDSGNAKLNDKIVGDVDFDEVKNKCSYITPVPGGVGPMTIAILMEDILSAHYLQKKKSKPNFKRFNDLKQEDINFDFHIHTNYTDGLSSPEEMVNRAIQLKLNAIAFTEHVNKTSDWFKEFSDRINSLKKNKNIKIFLGIEAKANDFKGTIDATQDMITNSDIVMGVVHRYPDGKGDLIPLEEIKNIGQEKSAEIEFNLTMGLLENKNIHILGHPFGVYSKFFTKLPEDYMKKLMTKALEKNIAIEINTKYLLENKKFFRLLREINPYVSIGSDAHDKEDIAIDFDIIKEEIKK